MGSVKKGRKKSNFIKVNSIKYLILLISGLPFCSFCQTSGTYNQYMNNLTPVNAAYSMLDDAGTLSMLVRSQFVGIDGAPVSAFFNGSLPIRSVKGAAGLLVKNDKFAVENSFVVNGFFAKSIQLTNTNFLSVSLSLGIRSYVANYSRLDPSDPQFRNDVRETQPNLGFGVMYYTPKFYVGLSVPELTVKQLGIGSVEEGNQYFKNKYHLAAAYLTELGDGIKFKPATLFTYANGSPSLLNVSGTFFFQDVFGIGANYLTSSERSSAAGIATFNFKTIRLGYSYQFGASSGVGSVSNAINEITLSYRFGSDMSAAGLF